MTLSESGAFSATYEKRAGGGRLLRGAGKGGAVRPSPLVGLRPKECPRGRVAGGAVLVSSPPSVPRVTDRRVKPTPPRPLLTLRGALLANCPSSEASPSDVVGMVTERELPDLRPATPLPVLRAPVPVPVPASESSQSELEPMLGAREEGERLVDTERLLLDWRSR